MRSASPMKLYSGEWGAWVTGRDVMPGMLIRVSASNGKSWISKVKKVLWQDASGAICETKSASVPSSAGARAKTHCMKCGRQRNDCECQKDTDPIVVGFDGTTHAGSHGECKRCGVLLNDQENTNGFCGNCLL